VLGVINSSPGDLAPVFDVMLERAMSLCEAAFGELFTFEAERMIVAASRGVPMPLTEFRRQNRDVRPGTVPAQMRDGTDVVHIPDIVETDAYKAGVS